MKQWKYYDEWGKRQKELDKIKHYCKCGHTVYIPKRNRFVYCTWCFSKVFPDEKSEFEYNIFRCMGQVNNKEVK